MFLTDFNFPKLQKASFNCLMLMEYDGIKVKLNKNLMNQIKNYPIPKLYNLTIGSSRSS